MHLLSTETAKIQKSTSDRLILMHHLILQPGERVCPWSCQACRETCLETTGRLRFDSAKAARERRTALFFDDRPEFFRQLRADLTATDKTARRQGRGAFVRLNTLSDLPWERIAPNLFQDYPDIQFYDYTKSLDRALESVSLPSWPANYHLTWSYLPKWDTYFWEQVTEYVELGGNIAVIFDGPLPSVFLGRPVIDGDLHDIRPWDARGIVVGLKAKGALLKRQPKPFFVVSC